MTVALLLLPSLLLAGETITVHLVEVPVTVIGRDGNPVRGLKPENFQLFDDGKPQKITSFDAIDFAAPQPATALSPLNANARRTFLLLFDLGYSDVKMIDRARDAARRFVSANVQPRDLVAVGAIEPEKGFRLLTAFTTDRSVANAAIADPRRYRGVDPLQLSDIDAFGQPVATISENFTNAEGAGRGAEADAARQEIRDLTNRNNRDFVAGRIDKQIDALGSLASMLRAVPGRKQLVLLSPGFDASILRGREARGGQRAEMADMAKATSGQAYLINSDDRFGNTASLNTVEQMVKLFKQSDVVLNAIDIMGVRSDNLTAGGQTQNSDGLHLLADPTGGTVFGNTNDLRTSFDKMMKQQEVVYVLGFQATAVKPGKMHDLSVKLVNAPAATVHHRVAYYEGSATETNVERALSNAQIIINDIPQNDVHMAVLATAIPGLTRAAVPLFVEIDGNDLLGGATAPVPADIFVYAFDEKGVVRDRLFQHLDIDPAKAGEKVKQSGIKYFATMSLPPGRYAVKTLVALPQAQKRGFYRTDLVVPAASELSVLPPLFLDKPGQWGMLKGVQHDTTPYPFHLDGQTFVPSAMPRLRASDKGEFALFLYNANPEEMMMQATVTDAAGVTRPAAPSLLRQLRSGGVTKLVFQYAPSGLAAGPATLDLLVHKKGSPEVRRASVPLVVVN